MSSLLEDASLADNKQRGIAKSQNLRGGPAEHQSANIGIQAPW
jgi:hypothetical protein